MAFGYVIDYACKPKDALGGTLVAPTRIAEGATLEPDSASCIACNVAAVEGPGCMGIVQTPLSVEAERWLCDRLPDAIESVAGEMVKLAVQAGSIGERGKELRVAGKLTSKMPFERTWGSVFRRFTVTTDQVLEQLFCVGDIEPPHALALLVQLGALAIDGRVPQDLGEEGGRLGELIDDPPSRTRRTQCTITPTPSDDSSVAELKRFLRALHASLCVDAKILIFSD